MAEGDADVVVVGAGIVGLAIAREVAAYTDLSVLLVEAGPSVLSGAASSGNSGILHTPLTENAARCPVEVRAMRLGYRRALAYLSAAQLPHRRCGAVVAARNASEVPALREVEHAAAANGVAGIRFLADATAVREVVPELAGPLAAGLDVPGDVVVDSWQLGVCYAMDVVRAGGAVLTNFTVAAAEQDPRGGWILSTADRARTVTGRVVVNAAGVNADVVASLSGRPAGFATAPRRGQFLVLDGAGAGAGAVPSRIVYSVPTRTSKGVLLAPAVHGGAVLVGPTAEDQDSRVDRTVDPATSARLRRHASDMIPRLADADTAAEYVGIRNAVAGVGDYLIQPDAARRWITVANIRSTGATAALGIAADVARLATDLLGAAPPVRRDVREAKLAAVSGRLLRAALATTPPTADAAVVPTADGAGAPAITVVLTHPLARLGARRTAAALSRPRPRRATSRL